MKAKSTLEELLNQIHYGLDTLTMLSDVEHFIEFSERNIVLQRQQELQLTNRECNQVEFDDPNMKAQYHYQMLEGVEYRFDVSLTQRVRYAGLTAFITTIEWCLLALKNRASFVFPRKPELKNEAVHVLTVFNEGTALDLESKIQLLDALVQVRNCVVHAAGLLASYRHKEQLRQTLSTLHGIKASNSNFLGESIEVESGFLEQVILDAKDWLPKLEKEASLKGLLKN